MYKFDLEDYASTYRYLKCKTLSDIEANNGNIVKNSDGTLDVYFNNIKDYSVHNKSCCEILGYNFDINTQKCYWSSIPNEGYCTDCTTKVVYNPKDNDGTLFNVNQGETCTLDISLDYILNFDCDLFSKVCDNNSENIQIQTISDEIYNLQLIINNKKIECESLTNRLEGATTLFNSLCYVIKGNKTNTSTFWVEETFGQAMTVDRFNYNLPIRPIFNTGTTNTVNIYGTTLNTFDEVPTFNLGDVNSLDTTITPYTSANIYVYDNIIPLGVQYSTLDFSSNNSTIDYTSFNQINNQNPPPFAWQWQGPYGSGFITEITPYNTTTSGLVTYCLTERGLLLWSDILGETKYLGYTNTFGCDETIYTQDNFNDLVAQVGVEINKDQRLKTTDFYFETTQKVCDKNVANIEMGKLIMASEKCTSELENLNNQLISLNNELNLLQSEASSNTPISNLESLEVHINLEVENDNGTYTSIYEEPLFNIGKGNLLNYILNESPDTGILISGATSGGILEPAFSYSEKASNLYGPLNCDSNRTRFINDLYLQQYKGVYPDPTTPEEELELNKKLNAWYNSSWLYYNRRLDESIVSQIKNKKIKISLRIENCCLNLCILTDNLNLTKSCESLDNQEIIISESPKFEIERVMDNKKSWVSYTENTSREYDLQFRETQYNIDDYRLSINTKEIELKIDGSNAIEEDVLCVIDCLISGDTETTVSGTCCDDKCDYGHTSNILNISKSFSNGKKQFESNGYVIGFSIKSPLFKSLDTFINGDYQELIKQGIWVPVYPKTNVHVWWENSLIDEIEGTSSCDPEDYAATNRAWRDAAVKAKNQLLLATGPFDWATYEIPKFVAEKYYLNRECSESEFRIGEAGPGGWVAYVDETGQHGLIYTYYNDTPTYWHSTDADLVNASNDGLYSGETNTSLIVSAYGSESNAAKYCSDYTSPSYSDYYLPSKYELNLIAQNWEQIGVRLPNATSYVWSSTENDATTAWAQNIYDGTQAIYNKSTPLNVIVVRKF